jgi:predicted enzyme related to lactoylglutathione lyase
MPQPEIALGAPCWIDLMTSDPDRAKEFYTRMSGWTCETGDQDKYGGYIMAFRNGQPVAGLMKNDGRSGYPDLWTTYLRAEDQDAFGWKTDLMSDIPAFRHTNLGAGDNAAAGIMDAAGFLPDGDPGRPHRGDLQAQRGPRRLTRPHHALTEAGAAFEGSGSCRR